ncbi:hypothetical protein RU61_00790 [Salmonella enterica subsp. enterica serovar Derby]|nr:hypothetical protein RU61_00790 [Salmonella enterica subsp. enterica serovar Derby]
MQLKVSIFSGALSTMTRSSGISARALNFGRQIPDTSGARVTSGTVIDRCRLVSRTDFMISAGIRKNSPTGNIHPDGLTKKFVKARKISGAKFSDNPPTFHEIRSLPGRLYKDELGEEFAQKLLGHTSENTTKLYLDERDNKAYVML